MDTRPCCRRHSCQVDDEISDLAEEVVLIRVPVCPSIHVRIGVDDGHTFERRGSFDGRKGDSISDNLGVVELNHGFADYVRTRRKIDKGGSDCGRVASLTAPISYGDGLVDGFSIVGVSIACKRY